MYVCVFPSCVFTHCCIEGAFSGQVTAWLKIGTACLFCSTEEHILLIASVALSSEWPSAKRGSLQLASVTEFLKDQLTVVKGCRQPAEGKLRGTAISGGYPNLGRLGFKGQTGARTRLISPPWRLMSRTGP